MKSILFKPFLAKQVRDGNKTQTRRIMKPQPMAYLWSMLPSYKISASLINCNDGLTLRISHEIDENDEPEIEYRKPKYKIGETIYVKETFEINGAYSENLLRFWVDIKYSYGKTECFAVEQDIFEKYYEKVGKKYSPLFIPEIFARDFLKITNIGAEKLQDISEEDAKAEGVEYNSFIGCYMNYLTGEFDYSCNTAKESFRTLWDSINGKDKSKCWDANPWVFVYEFEVVK